MSNELRRDVKLQSPKRGLGLFVRELPERLDGRLCFFLLVGFSFFAPKKEKPYIKKIKNFLKIKICAKNLQRRQNFFHKFFRNGSEGGVLFPNDMHRGELRGFKGAKANIGV